MDNINYNKVYLKLKELRDKAEKNKNREILRKPKSGPDENNRERHIMYYDGLADGYTIAISVLNNNGVL